MNKDKNPEQNAEAGRGSAMPHPQTVWFGAFCHALATDIASVSTCVDVCDGVGTSPRSSAPAPGVGRTVQRHSLCERLFVGEAGKGWAVGRQGTIPRAESSGTAMCI